ncbi:MAG TPA: hypothetical protein ENJ54_07915 [Chloroflexi bacterium]|nr:hypothetical protein [Chloroflexota bacterium]
MLWTGCQWKAVHRDWFGVSSSVLHERFQTWQREGRWERPTLHRAVLCPRTAHRLEVAK